MNVRDTSFGSRLFDTVIIVLMVIVVLATLFPFYQIVIISLSNGNAVLRGEVKLFPVGFTLDAYRLVMQDAAIPRALLNSVIYTTVGTILNLAMTILCAYPLARSKFSGRTIFTWMVAFTMLFSGGLIPLYLLIMQLGLLNSMWAVILPTAINPWFMFILRTSFKDIDEAIYEAATIDGANDLQVLWKIAIPLAKPALATLLLFYAVAQWNEFFYPLIFLDDRTKYPIQLLMRNIVLLGRFEQTNELAGGTDFAVIEQTLKYATIMVSTLPILAVYPFVQKYFVKGVMVGAIKG
jgi:putative aldouronate transport system permease protein